MYGKIFESMYEGSLYGHFEAIVTFQALIVFADEHGVVDMTPQALAGHTSYPLDLVEKGLAELAEPDPISRSKLEDGRRIIPLDPTRTWGWIIVNYGHYCQMTSRKERAEYQKQYYKTVTKPKRSSVNKSQQDSTDSSHIDIDIDIDKNKKDKKPARFKPPTLDEVINFMFCIDQRNAADESEKFMDYYTSNGWKVGKNKMKDWQATARNWMRRSNEAGKRANGKGGPTAEELLTNTDW